MSPEQQSAADYFKELGALGTDPNYDYVAARQAGVRPDVRGHLPDEFKLPTHITFSDQSIHNDGGAGRWRWSFTPGPTNLKHHNMQELKNYFNESEPDAILLMDEMFQCASAYERGVADAIEMIRMGTGDVSAGEDIRKIYDGILATAEHRVRKLIRHARDGLCKHGHVNCSDCDQF